ncbi:MAG: sigma-B regulation protein RsbU (phosphoserine phosphatase) [Verrucomicrobiales bacterium]|jgi:sigma-B regulation protein RsbU (phosphoserine phosphatase)
MLSVWWRGSWKRHTLEIGPSSNHFETVPPQLLKVLALPSSQSTMTPEFLGTLVLATLVTIWLIMWKQRGGQLEKLAKRQQEFEGEETRLFDFLHELGESLYEDQPVPKIQRRIVDGMRKVVSAQRGGCLYVVDQTGKLVPAYVSKDCVPLIPIPEEIAAQHATNDKSVSSHIKLQTIAEGEGMLGRSVATREFERIEDIATEPELHNYPHLLSDQRDVGAMVAPLYYGDKPLGVMAVMGNGSNGGFSSHDFEVFKSAAEQSAFAFGSALVHQEVLGKRRIEDELKSAREIQKVLLPSKPPAFTGWKFAGTNVPASVVSGDYYDYIKVDKEHLGVVIADVSGKGIPASLVMATCRGLVRMNARGEASPGETLKKVNRFIFGDMREDMFISMAYCVLTHEGQVVLTRAGHDPPLLFRKETGKIERLKPGGLAVGIDKGTVFDRVTKEMTLQMEAGDCLLLYTDGATDAIDSKGREEFSLDQLEKCFASAAAAAELGAPKGILAALTKRLEAFVGSHQQMDDITLIAIQRQ